jgi:hypothetical protein
MNEVFAFECGIVGTEFRTIVNARSRGKAKSQYWRDVLDAFQGLPYTKVTARKIDSPRTSEQFRRCAKNRGLPELRCGDRVQLAPFVNGVVVGHDASANFRVLFDDDSDKYPGMTLSVHPSEMSILT